MWRIRVASGQAAAKAIAAYELIRQLNHAVYSGFGYVQVHVRADEVIE